MNALYRFGGLGILNGLLIGGLWLVIGLARIIVSGCVTSRIAGSKGRDTTGWFFIGAFTGLFGMVAALVMLPAEYYETGSSRRPPLT